MGRSSVRSLQSAVAAWFALLLVTSPGAALQTTVGGRPLDVDTALSVREVIEENGSTTHERTLEMLRVRFAASIASWLRFESTTVGTNGGPTLSSDRGGLYNFDDVFQGVSPAVDFQEAYFDVLLPSTDLRVGLQKVAWGKLDRTQPNDLINTLSYIDPFLQDEAERKIGTPAIQASYYFPTDWGLPEESRLTAVWVGKYVPFRFPTGRCVVENDVSQCSIERWFPPAAVPPPTFTVPLPQGGAIAVPVSFRALSVPEPWRLENTNIGLRYAGLIHEADVAGYYYHGLDAQPAFELSAAALGQPDPTGPPPHVKDLSGATTLTPIFKHIDSWGADGAYAIDRFTIRVEGAFVSNRAFTRDLHFLVSNPSSLAPQLPAILQQLAQGKGSVPVTLPDSFVVRDSLEWGVGADYVYNGYMLLLQLNQTDVFHNDVDLLIKNVDTRVLGTVRKNFFSDRLLTQLIALYAFESSYTMLRPRLQYKITDNLLAEAGYLFIAGRQQSVVGQYKRNGEGWVRMEYRL